MLTYEVKCFKKSTDAGYYDALKIYNDRSIISSEVRTNTNEITAILDKTHTKKGAEMYFFGLLFNNNIIGFAELAYLNEVKTIFIDYIAISHQHKKNSIFYPFLNLVINYVGEHNADYRYVITEVRSKTRGTEIDQDSSFFRKMLSNEDFSLLEAPYYQPKLGDNLESNLECQLLIKISSQINQISKETYLDIIHSIYYSHYLSWYSAFMTDAEAVDYNKHINIQYERIKNGLKNQEEIKYIKYEYVECEYYDLNNCVYLNDKKIHNVNIGAGLDPSILPKKEAHPFIPIFIATILVVTIAFVIYGVLISLGISVEQFSPILVGLTPIVSGLTVIGVGSRFRQ